MKKVVVFTLVALSVLAQAQTGGGGGRGGARGGGNSMTGLLNRADVAGELKLSDDQKAKLAELAPQRGAGGQRNAGGAAGGGAAGGGQGTFDPAAAAQRAAEREKQILAILNEGQAKRLKELYIQRVGNRAVSREDIQKELGLSTDQVAKIKELQDKQRTANQELQQKIRNQEVDQQEGRDIMTKNGKTLDEELGKILTSDQASKLKAMRGTEFTFEEGN